MAEEVSKAKFEHCPECDKKTHCTPLFKESRYTEEREDGHLVYGADNDYYILRCEGCHTVFFLHAEMIPEEDFGGYTNKKVYPHPPSQVNSIHEMRYDVLEALKNKKWNTTYSSTLYEEICCTINNKNRISTMLAIRSLLGEICRLKTSSNEDFSANLNRLKRIGFLASKSKSVFQSIIDVGNDATHHTQIPDIETLQKCILTIEALIVTLFIVPQHGEDIKKVILPRQRNARKIRAVKFRSLPKKNLPRKDNPKT